MSRQIVCLDDFEKFACDTLPSNVREYFRGGADEEVTLSDNRTAFTRWRLLPRVLVDVRERLMESRILGHKLTFPVCVAPMGWQKTAHPDGEQATARAAATMGIGFTLSTMSTTSLEDVVTAAPDGLKFFQLYVFKQRDITKQLIRRAERCGYSALLVTLDVPVLGMRRADRRNRMKLPPHLELANFSGMKMESQELQDQADLFDPSLTWEDVEWLRTITTLPLVLKGILTGKDATIAAGLGVAGILVSNHGGRQLDTVPATIDVLEEVVRAVAGRCEVYLDGGIRCGTDVLKALALGATAVFLGRPCIYGLAYNGEAGVQQVLEILRGEFSLAMALTGVSKISDIQRDMVIHERRLFANL